MEQHLLNKNKAKPNGGVKKLVCKFIANIKASHTGSYPIAIKDGPTIGTITKTIWKKSKKKPRKKITIIIIIKEIAGPPDMFVINFSTIRSSKPSENK